MKDFSITVEDKIKKFRSKDYNYNFNLENGYFERWGKTEDEDPIWSPYGPEILDIEISTKCNGVDGKLCAYCYKSNTPNGKNTSYEDFVKYIDEVNYNGQLTQVAFGLGSTAEENPDLWKMCDYLRANNVIPNGTVAELSQETANKIAKNFGAVAISYHSSWEVLERTIKRLDEAKNLKNATLKQINIHFMICEQTYDDAFKLLFKIKNKEIIGVNAVVFLSLKKCGRANNNNFFPLGEKKFEKLIKFSLMNNIGIGFDSCSANKFSKAIKNIISSQSLIEKYEQLTEPCESGIFSSYLNVDGNFYPCSFNEHLPGFNVIEVGFKNIWEEKCKSWREILLKNNRNCPEYII